MKGKGLFRKSGITLAPVMSGAMRRLASRLRVSPETDWWFEDFMDFIGPDADGGCWPWLGTCQENHRAIFCVSGRKWLAAHLSLHFEGHHRPTTKHVAMHSCDNPNCVNPEHLSWGLQADNMADMKAKGRANAPKGEAAHNAKLTNNQVREIRKSTETQRVLGKRFGVDPSKISLIKNRKAWAHVED